MSLQGAFAGPLERSAQRLLESIADLSEEEAVARPQGLTPVAWQVGHVILAEGNMLRRAGAASPVPGGYQDLFGQGTRGEGNLPPLAELRDRFGEVHARTLELAAADPERPVESTPAYATVGQAMLWAQYHRGFHVGKIATLRALLGKVSLR